MNSGTEGGRAQRPAGTDLLNDGFLSFPEVRRQTGNLSRSTYWRMERAGAFPSRRQISARRVGWLASEIRAWIEARQKTGVTFNGSR